MKPDDVCRSAAAGVKLTIRELGDVVLLEGDAAALRFLSELIGAQAEANDDGFEISPNGPGMDYFSTESEKGIYIHRLGPPIRKA